MADTTDFERVFEELTGNAPLSWQTRLYTDHFAKNDLPDVIDLPTGLGKTMVMAIWLVAWAKNKSKDKDKQLPRRLIYVVDRRTVVDQATDIAQRLVARPFSKWMHQSFGDMPLAISTLRGQLADNREWSRDPSRPAIIIGTVDLIGSALLFSGYRSGYKTRPLHAGLLGQDSLLVLDEAHLSKPFDKLVTSITDFQRGQGMPMKVIRMSATTKGNHEKRFKLEQFDQSDSIVRERFRANKTLKIATMDDPMKSVAATASDLAKAHPGSRIVVFVKSPKDVELVRKALIPKDKSYATKIAMLTGTMRGLERDELVTPPVDESQHERRVMQRFLTTDNDTSQGECFLISTSAGEVGFDLNADHMVCDAAPLDSMIQRLGRVNRRGQGDASIRLILASKPSEKTAMEQATNVAATLFTDGMDVSPQALAVFKSSLAADLLHSASTPEPTTVELTDILLDAWSMTSITAPMPGRPEVAPWIRGIAEDLPQTTIAWRAELDLHGFNQLRFDEIQDWFETHRILTHESLSVPTSVAAKWFVDRWNNLPESERMLVGKKSIVVDRAGTKLVLVEELIDQLSRKSGDVTAAIRNADLILPAAFGGIERHKGLLDADVPTIPQVEESSEAQDRARDERSNAIDVADARERFRQVITKTEDGEPDTKTIGSGIKKQDWSKLVFTLASDDSKRVQLISYVPKREKLEFGTTRQTLSQHVRLVRKYADDVLKGLDLPEPIKLATKLAADFHDHGKNRQRWQNTIGGMATPGTTEWLNQTQLEDDGKHQAIGKSGGTMKRDPRGYRHEFGSIREFIDAHEGKIEPEVADLALHLIAVHHGRSRPHFAQGGFDPDFESRSETVHIDAIRRFAQLQRKYGHWRLAWLENLLRCADALASGDPIVVDGIVKQFSESVGGAK